jgi:SAM-dependent methyltransferase
MSEIVPRYAFLEALLPGARLLEVGAASGTGGGSAAYLRSRGAKSVLSLDVDPAGIEAARRDHAADPELRFLAGRLEDVEGPFDLILVADAGPLVRAPSALDCVARLLGEPGHAVFALRHPAGPSLAALAGDEPAEAPPTWGELLSELQSRFASVESAAQSVFLGYRISPARSGLETAVDATLTHDEEPSYFLAIAGAAPSGALGAEEIVALPASPLAVASGRRAELGQRLRLAEDELAQVRRELANLTAATSKP